MYFVSCYDVSHTSLLCVCTHVIFHAICDSIVLKKQHPAALKSSLASPSWQSEESQLHLTCLLTTTTLKRDTGSLGPTWHGIRKGNPGTQTAQLSCDHWCVGCRLRANPYGTPQGAQASPGLLRLCHPNDTVIGYAAYCPPAVCHWPP